MSINRLLIILTFLAIVLVAPGCLQRYPPEEAMVTEVIDGDTIVIEEGWRVRYIGIDAPEIGEDFYEEASEANRALVEGKVVRLEKDVSDTDQYGRLLRYVYADDLFVNGELVSQGYAYAKAYPPDTKYQDILEGLEEEAEEVGRGLWCP